MRKISVLLCALILVLAQTTLAVAAADGDVLVTVNYTAADGEYRTTAEEGKYGITTDDGFVITVTPETVDDSLILVVYPVPNSDTEAFAWFESLTAELGEDGLYYDIYFINNKGERVHGGDCTVEIALPQSYERPTAAQVAKDGTVKALVSKLSDGKISFDISEGGFYTVVNEAEAQLPSEDIDSDTDAPATGDKGIAFFALCAVVCASAAVLIIRRKA